MILIKSPGFRFSIPGRFAFSSHNFTLAVEPASYTVIVLRSNVEPSFLENCFVGERFNTLVSNEISFAPAYRSFKLISVFDDSVKVTP